MKAWGTVNHEPVLDLPGSDPSGTAGRRSSRAPDLSPKRRFAYPLCPHTRCRIRARRSLGLGRYDARAVPNGDPQSTRVDESRAQEPLPRSRHARKVHEEATLLSPASMAREAHLLRQAQPSPGTGEGEQMRSDESDRDRALRVSRLCRGRGLASGRVRVDRHALRSRSTCQESLLERIRTLPTARYVVGRTLRSLRFAREHTGGLSALARVRALVRPALGRVDRMLGIAR